MGGMRMQMRIATPQGVQGGVVTTGGQYINQGIRQPITMTPQVNLPPRYGTPNFDQSGNMVQVQVSQQQAQQQQTGKKKPINFIKNIFLNWKNKRSIFLTSWKQEGCPDFFVSRDETSNFGYFPIF